MTSPVQQRRRTLAISSAAGLALTAVIVLLLNVLSSWLYLRWDMTRSGAYSLSPSSKQLMRGLDDRFIIKAYFTPDLPPPYNVYERYVRDMLTEYRAASRGKLRFQFVPASPPQAFEQEATQAGIAPLQIQQVGSDNLAIRRGFMGMTLVFGDRTEVLPVVKDISTLEYDLTSRIARLTIKSKKTILLSAGHGEPAWRSDPNSKLAQDISQLYNLQDVALMPGTTAPLAGDALVIVGPNLHFDEKALWSIDQAIMRGIPTAFLVDTKAVYVPRFMVSPANTGLPELLKHYGVDLGDALVYDAQCEAVGMSQNIGGLQIPISVRYPYIPDITNLDSRHPILRGLEVVPLPFPVTVTPAPTLPAEVRFTPLFKTSEQSWLAPTDSRSISPMMVPKPLPDEPHGPYVVGGVLDGVFASYFQGKPLPFPGLALVGTSPKTQIVVIGTSHVLDPSMPQFPGMEALMTNMMAWLSHDETLLGIQSKGEIVRPLKPVSGSTRQAVKILCTLGVALLPALLGLVRWRRRGRWREHIRAQFAPRSPIPVAPIPGA